jgi:serine/threonine-protein kinase
MSPEQIEGEDVDIRSDIFSFGTMLYEMAGGKNPHQGKSSTQTMYKVLKAAPEPIDHLREELPEPFIKIISRCMSKNPDDRYDDIRDLLAELKSLKATFS